ncbi:MAG TPA: hypothetical protein VJ852_05400 [Gemmatimonadaceae bacterium]|nr:hypothetical protein [Gemmatimonadaceae bacterium]
MFLLTTLFLGCAGPATNNRLASDLAREDQLSRTGGTVSRSDKERVDLILNELAHNRITTAEDKFNAALILDHSPMTFRGDTLVAKSPDNYLLAHYLARSAVESGNADAKLLVAQTVDRYLSMTTGCQKYGTNRFINQATGAEELSPIDRKTTDEERAQLGVPPLAKLLSQFREQRRSCISAGSN